MKARALSIVGPEPELSPFCEIAAGLERMAAGLRRLDREKTKLRGVLTGTQAARELGLSPSAITRAVQMKLLPARRYGRALRIERADLEQFKSQREG